MKAAGDCYQCLRRLACQAAELATEDSELRSKAIREALQIIDRHFSSEEVPIVIATQIHQAVKEQTKNPDPYREMKDEEMKIARELVGGMAMPRGFRGLLKLSVLGNTLDFFQDFDAVKRDMGRPVRLAIDDVSIFEGRLKQARTLLFLADNAGEVFFDLPLVKWMERLVRVTYVVKAAPAGDDLTIQDLERCGLEREFGAVITTGTATPGVVLSMASAEFKQELNSCDLVLAKGMAYYEALSELPGEGRILFCLKAKCQPVAHSLGVPLNSYVAKLW